ncbi:MAG: hypothetical protein ACRD36_14365 [Candidatus Acidiferrum sp.]
MSNEYATLTAVSGGVKKYEAKLGLVPTAEAAREYLERKKSTACLWTCNWPGRCN